MNKTNHMKCNPCDRDQFRPKAELKPCPTHAMAGAAVLGALLAAPLIPSFLESRKSVEGMTMFNVHYEDYIALETRHWNQEMEVENDYLFYTDCPIGRLRELVRETFLEGLSGRRAGTPVSAVLDRFREAGWYCTPVQNRVPERLTFSVNDIEDSVGL